LRELDLLVRRLLVLHGHEPLLKRAHLSKSIGQASAPRKATPETTDRDDHEFSQLIAELRNHRGNVARAATSIGISRQRAYRLMESRGSFDLEAFRSQL